MAFGLHKGLNHFAEVGLTLDAERQLPDFRDAFKR